MSFERRFLGDEERFIKSPEIPDSFLFPVNTVLQGDCLDLMYNLPEHSVDLILTDLPYNIAKDGKVTQIGGKPIYNKDAWGDTFNDNFTDDEYLIFIKKLSDAFDYVLKPEGSIIIFFDRGRPHNLKPLYDQFILRNTLVFIKKNPIPHFRKNNYRSGFEQCAWFTRAKYHINFITQRKMINVFKGYIGNPKKTDHPTEKYEWMIYPLIERHSKVGDIVLDPMCGSGSTLVCAKKLQRRFIGMDLEEKWVKLSQKRVSELPMPLSHFTVPPNVRSEED